MLTWLNLVGIAFRVPSASHINLLVVTGWTHLVLFKELIKVRPQLRDLTLMVLIEWVEFFKTTSDRDVLLVPVHLAPHGKP